MLKLTVFEFIVRTLPEAFIFILASYAISNHKIYLKRYIISSVLVALSVYLIRMFPINYGVHTILNIITQAVILISINKIDIIMSVKSAIITTICLFVLELFNMLALNIIFKEQLTEIMLNPIFKTISGLPSLAIFLLITLFYYYIRKKGRFKYVKN